MLSTISSFPHTLKRSRAESKSKLSFVLRQRLEPHVFDRQLAELIDLCLNYGIEEVLLFPHGVLMKDSPTGMWSEEEVRHSVHYLRLAKEGLARRGVRMGINLWNMIGHGDRGRVAPAGMQMLVSEEGRAATSQPCPLCPIWQDYIKYCLRSYASIHPSKLFYDDDFRHHNHGSDAGTGRFNCFCPLHLERFRLKTGRSYTRESLLQEVLRPGKPSDVRTLWLNDLNDVIVELSAELEACIHEVSPETEIGLMSSGADQVMLEGRDFRKLLPAVAGEGRRMHYRPCFSYYIEPPPKDLTHVLALYRSVLPDLPEKALLYAEIDNCMPTEYNSSPSHMATRMLLAAICGTRRFHLSFFSWYGNADTYTSNREYVAELPGLEEVVSNFFGDLEGKPVMHGFYLPRNPRMVLDKFIDSPEAGIAGLAVDTLRWAKPLQLAGFPITLENPAPVRALTADALWGLSPCEIDELLKGAVLADFTALEWLVQRGFGEKVGVKATRRHRTSECRQVMTEEIVDEESPFKGAYFEHGPLQAMIYEARMELAEEAKVITRLKGRAGQDFGPGAFEFHNELGGAVMGVPLLPEAIEYNPFLCHYRIDALRRWLTTVMPSWDTPFFYVENSPNGLPLHARYGEVHLLSWVNLRSQSAANLRLRCFRIPKVYEVYLWREGKLSEVNYAVTGDSWQEYRLTINQEVPPYGILLVRAE